MTGVDDIRAGNKVLLNISGSTVTVLKVEHNRIQLDTFPEASYYSNIDVSGIPLTTDMLRELSFTNEKENSTWVGQGINIHAKPDGFFYGLRILKTRAKMQYLHQLQNYLTDFYTVFKDEDRVLDLLPLCD